MHCSLTVLEDDKMDFLFGLDNLKRHNCVIDLKNDCLVFSDIDVKLPFLGQADIPSRDRLAGSGHDQAANAVSGPAPTTTNHNNNNSSSSNNTTTSTPAPKPTPTPPSSTSNPSDPVAQLMSLGFSREECTKALARTGGNVDMAAALLFGGV
jgi:DNA damage-inducible protein 1